ncbi:MAG: DMT family transporter [bacterium]|nr:DMT family transporter [bacterium]
MENHQDTTKKPFIDLTKSGWQWTFLIGLAFIWGTSFILMKKGLESFTFMQVAALRLFLSFVFLIPLIIKCIHKLKKTNLKSILIVAYVGTAIPSLLFTKSQTQINSSLAGMLNSLTPLFTLLIGYFFYQKGTTRKHNVIGVFVGLAGAMGLLFKGQQGIFDEINSYALFIIVATACYGTTVNEIKYHLAGLDGVTITALNFLMCGPLAGVYLFFSDYSKAHASEGGWVASLIYIAILALFSSVIALAVFNTLIKYTTALFAASVTYIIPVFAILWGVVDGETITVPQLMWILVIFVGVYMVNKKSS